MSISYKYIIHKDYNGYYSNYIDGKTIEDLKSVKHKNAIIELSITHFDDEILNLDLSIFINLEELYICNNRNLKQIPRLDKCIKLKKIDFYNNDLTQLPNIYSCINLKSLLCNNNKLTELPCLDSLNNLEYLSCSNNKLTHLPSLDSSYKLTHLYCCENELITLPSFKNTNKLKLLSCYNNKLHKLPSFQGLNHLKYLECHDNEINELPRSIIYCTSLQYYKSFNNDNSNYYENIKKLPELINWIITEKYYYNCIMKYYYNIYVKKDILSFTIFVE